MNIIRCHRCARCDINLKKMIITCRESKYQLRINGKSTIPKLVEKLFKQCPLEKEDEISTKKNWKHIRNSS